MRADRRTAKRIGLTAAAVLLLLGAFAAFAAVRSGKKLVFTTGFGKDEVFCIGSATCTVPELMVYLTTTQNRYENVYGEEVWNVSKDGVTLEENVKETVLASMAQMKTMYLLAEEKQLALDEDEEEKVNSAAEEYFSSLNDREKELMGVDEETILRLYTEYALADKVYEYIIRDVNPEISDDEARTITVQHIFLQTYMLDGDGIRVDYSDAAKQTVYEKACDIRQQAVSGEADFTDLASKYSDDSVITYSFGKGETEAAVEEAAFLLETDEISEVIETENGYQIIKCLSTFDREQTDLSKLEIVEQRKKEVFEEEYNDFVESLTRQLNTKLWDEISLIHDEQVVTTGFFEVYEKYFAAL